MRSVSIVIPCFNAAATLGDAVESALTQRDLAIDIVVVDDGSTDASVTIAREFAPHVQIFQGSHRGVSAARNRGIAETRGEWIVFLDADDFLVPETLRKRLDTAEATGADVVVCDWQEFVGSGTERISQAPISANMRAFANDPEVACATHWKPAIDALMFRRSLVRDIGGFHTDLPIVEDARLLFEAAVRSARFARSEHIGAHVRIVNNSLSRRDPALFWRCCLLNGRQIEALWRARGALSHRQAAALCDIYNSAAHGLFRARDADFRQALSALRASHLPIRPRHRLAELLSDVVGQRQAVRLAEQCTRSRRAAARLVRRRPAIRSAG